jgi:hypothetical protein
MSECKNLTKLAQRRFERNGKQGTIYSGRAAGGDGRGFGGQYLIIAADDAVLAKIWEALEGVEINPDLVYEASAIGTRFVNAIAPETTPSGGKES